MKVLSVVGTRPEFIQAAMVSRALRQAHEEVTVNTGQHYDYLMTRVFFEDLDLPEPRYHLGVGSGSHGRQSGEMLARLEAVMQQEQPDWVLIRGDTNTTLAGALAASKLQIPLAHLEAGMRSFNRCMPEEINRLVADHLSDLLHCPTETGVSNAAAEGIVQGVYNCGDVLYDVFLDTLPKAEATSSILVRLDLRPRDYLLATIHRAENTDHAQRFAAIVAALSSLDEPVLFPVHPRTRKLLDGTDLPSHILLVDPVGYRDMLVLERNARLILTDSGGVQREAYFHGVPGITLRDETEWVETVSSGWNVLVGAEKKAILHAVRDFHPTGDRPPFFGDGHASEAAVRLMEEHLGGIHYTKRVPTGTLAADAAPSSLLAPL